MTTRTTHAFARRLGAACLVTVLGSGLAACGDDTGETGSAGGGPGDTQTASTGAVFNDADVRFATDMVQHHAQAVQMVVMAQGRPLDPEVARLAEDIRDAQVPEIETMTDWLTDWGQEVPETSLDHANAGHDMDDMSGGHSMDMDMPGAMSEEQMDALENASDDEFQALWLEMMVEHHRGAVEMAESEREDGVNEDAVSLASSIVATQQAEIDTMDQLLQGSAGR